MVQLYLKLLDAFLCSSIHLFLYSQSHRVPSILPRNELPFVSVKEHLINKVNMENLPPDHFVTSWQFTPKAYIDVYPAIDPTSPANSQAGKVIVITGASRGLGSRVRLNAPMEPSFI